MSPPSRRSGEENTDHSASTESTEAKLKNSGSVPASRSPPESLLLRMADVIALTAISRVALINKINANEFCKPIRVGRRSIRFLRVEVMTWIAAKAQERNVRSR